MSRIDEIMQDIEERILEHEVDELTAEWNEAKARDLAEGFVGHRFKLWDEVKLGMWMAKYRWRQQAGAARRASKGSATRSDRAPVGRLVKAERAIAGLTLRQLAHLTGISRSALSRIETGQTWLSVARATLIAEALDISLDALRPASTPRDASGT